MRPAAIPSARPSANAPRLRMLLHAISHLLLIIRAVSLFEYHMGRLEEHRASGIICLYTALRARSARSAVYKGLFGAALLPQLHPLGAIIHAIVIPMHRAIIAAHRRPTRDTRRENRVH